ncbi:hypothetical protein IMG5_182270 [Ichthyophthirius multifiliis]|uniref:Transmembrane protein n=1 Tax=Ichthyophthirius multifiliis TaxID=5932 RepID=G0R311_ICHMU|nr:hypothetical protein IMG5_182270 [Ichthyophthirius multifiliis]EGR28143.1 hypothetical protein IMG5_182270 [Ichthyophthirius multifiliis]|eukprot:XP_004027488.1 hypothetical protein IMG5_182270 [Ichthyophthirius multifiliis]
MISFISYLFIIKLIIYQHLQAFGYYSFIKFGFLINQVSYVFKYLHYYQILHFIKFSNSQDLLNNLHLFNFQHHLNEQILLFFINLSHHRVRQVIIRHYEIRLLSFLFLVNWKNLILQEVLLLHNYFFRFQFLNLYIPLLLMNFMLYFHVEFQNFILIKYQAFLLLQMFLILFFIQIFLSTFKYFFLLFFRNPFLDYLIQYYAFLTQTQHFYVYFNQFNDYLLQQNQFHQFKFTPIHLLQYYFYFIVAHLQYNHLKYLYFLN